VLTDDLLERRIGVRGPHGPTVALDSE
jgi:hypothetical protein